MPAEESTSRTAVKTYVPAYQKDAWREHADELDMSQSEFVRTMVQAGRRHFSPDADPSPEESGPSEDATADAGDLTARIESLLDSQGPLSWDELLASLTDDVEARLDESLDELQASNTIKYSGRDGGYTLTDT
ncbi:DUF5805 domain-containing protein [Halorhabdus amylolytica]|uniref:DUF5805 domain-containing protein n=1 Tax=Halorhabdus amylolytica TaxID=2559573 RepID=UPI0010A9AA4D|nr:DUF5805 domain-containing protein [Halorhabdus amylolytica]